MRILSLLLLFASSGALAQTASVKGSVYDEPSGDPLDYASVSVYSSGDSSLVDGVVTSEGGKFLIDDLRPGSYYLTVQFIGYHTKTVSPAQLSAGQSLDMGGIGLRMNQQMLDEITVSGEALDNLHKIDKQVYRADRFETAEGGTAADLIRNMPSVAVNGQGEITFRGSGGFLLLVNGKPVQTDAETFLSQIPANTVENVELITSPSAKYDPDGRGGIINITTKKGADDGVSLIVNAQAGLPSTITYGNKESQKRFGGDLTFNYRKDKWDISASANYLRNDNAGFRDGDVFTIIDQVKTTFPSQGERSFDKYNYGGRFNIGFEPTGNDHFSLGFFASHKYQDRLADIFYHNTKTDMTTGEVVGRTDYFNSNLQNKQGNFILGNFDYLHTFRNESSLGFSVLYEFADLNGSTVNKNIEGTEMIQNTLNTYENPLGGLRVKADHVMKLGKGKLESGYQFRRDHQDGRFVYSQENQDGGFDIVPEFTGNVKTTNQIHSVYSQYSATAGRLDYIAGLRYEHSAREQTISKDENDHTLKLDNLFPSLNLLYDLGNGWEAKAGASRRVQRTSNFELNPIPEREHSETLEQGDPELLPEFISLAEAGIIKHFSKGSFFTTLYFQDIRNPIQRVNKVFADSILNRIYTNAGKARQYGIEAGTNLNPTAWWKLYLGANIYNYDIEGELFNFLKVGNSSWVYSINANSGFAVSPTFSIQAALNYLSGRPTAQGEDSRFLSPNISIKKTLLDGRLTAALQWQNIDMGLLESNEQRITTYGSDFYTTTNYIYEVDVLLLQLGFNLNKSSRKIKLPGSEFGEKEF